MGLRLNTREQVREAMGLVNASVWDQADGGELETMRHYMATSDATADEMIRGLVILCRATMGALGHARDMTLEQVVRHVAEKIGAWE